MPQESMENFKKLSLFQAILLSGIMAMFGNILVFYAAKLISIHPLIPVNPGSSVLTPLTLGPIIISTLVSAFLAGLIFWVLRRFFPKKAIQNFLIISVGFLVISFMAPYGLQESLSSRLTLCLMHIVAAVFIFGTLYNYHVYKK